MPLYTIYQQREPLRYNDGSERANLVRVGELEALSGPHAIDLASELPIFKIARRSTLAAFPIVELHSVYATGVYIAPPPRERGTGLYRTRHAPARTH